MGPSVSLISPGERFRRGFRAATLTLALLATTAGAEAQMAQAAEAAEAAAVASNPHPRPLAVTIDGFPAGPQTVGTERDSLVDTWIEAVDGGAPALAFVACQDLKPGDEELLRRWIEAGHQIGTLGDGPRLSEMGVDGFLAGVESCRALLDGVLASVEARVRHVRFPDLEEGSTNVEVRRIQDALDHAGLRNVRATVTTGDAATTELDTPERWLAVHRLAVLHHLRLGDRLLDRPLPQILRIEATPLAAATLSNLLDGLTADGHDVTDTDIVLSDPVFVDRGGEASRFGWTHWERLFRERDLKRTREQVIAVLAQMASSWNLGDLEGFCEVYARDAVVITPGGVTLGGRGQIRQQYRRLFGRTRTTMIIEPLSITPELTVARSILGRDRPARIHTATVVARWSVGQTGATARADGGSTLLVLHRDEGRWSIVRGASF